MWTSTFACLILAVVLAGTTTWAGVIIWVVASKMDTNTRVCHVTSVGTERQNNMCKITWAVDVDHRGAGTVEDITSYPQERLLKYALNTTAECWNFKNKPERYSWDNYHKIGEILFILGAVAFLTLVFINVVTMLKEKQACGFQNSF